MMLHRLSVSNDWKVLYQKVDVDLQRKQLARLVATDNSNPIDSPVGLLLNMWMGVQGGMYNSCVEISQRVSYGLVEWIAYNFYVDLQVNRKFNVDEMLYAQGQQGNTGKPNLLSHWLFAPTIWFSDICLVEISTAHNQLRQAFADGVAITPMFVGNIVESEPYVRFCFRTGKHIRSSAELTLDQVRLTYKYWNKSRKRYKLNDYKYECRAHLLPIEGFEMMISINKSK
jgi:hypothetical protein